jgi:hypothetical protein
MPAYLHRLILPDAAAGQDQPFIKMIHGGIFPQIEAVACAISAQVDDQPSSPFVAISNGEFKGVELRQRQEMKLVSVFAPQRLARHSSRGRELPCPISAVASLLLTADCGMC